MMNYYKGNLTGAPVGLLPDPYYWWEAGAMFGQMIEYWYYTGDTTYNDVVMQGMLAQIGPNNDYMPPNQTKTEVRNILIRADGRCHPFSRSGVQFKYGKADRLLGKRRSSILGICGIIGSRVEFPSPAWKVALMASSRPSCLQSSSISVGPATLWRWTSLANLLVQQWIRLQEQYIKRRFFPTRSSPRAIYW